jgi:putative membrane protein
MPIGFRANRYVPAALIVAALCGFFFLIYLIIRSGAADVAHAMLAIGWWLLPITVFHLVPMLFSALSWRELLPSSSRPGVFTVILIRWIRESINSLLLSVGGDVASVRLANVRGLPNAQAAASMVVDTTVGAVTQMIFVISGVALLLLQSSAHGVVLVACTVLIGTGALLAGIAGFTLFQHRGLFGGTARLLRTLLPSRWMSALSSRASALDDAVVATYGRGGALFRAAVLRVIGWIAGAGEIWLALHALGTPLGLVDAFILESLSSGVRAAAFMLPGALGALEGSFVLFGALFGLPADAALAISLSKRVRELALGLPGLLVWHWLEAHHLLRRGAQEHPDRIEASELGLISSPSGSD